MLRPPVDSVLLVDSITWRDYLSADDVGVLHRVELRSGATIDTVPAVLTDIVPVLVGDSLVIGIRFDSLGNVLGAFQYYARTGRLELVPIPSDLHLGATDMRFSPDGRHLAYVRFDSLQRAEGIVREWPSGTVVARTPSLKVPVGDALRGAARWTSPTDFELMVDPFETTVNRWVRFRGKLGVPGLVIDTATALPGLGLPPVGSAS